MRVVSAGDGYRYLLRSVASGDGNRLLSTPLMRYYAATQVLADDLGIGCENTAKWLFEHDHGRARLAPGQLVILDEASLASTDTLDRLTAIAATAGAKALLVGDWAQLQSVDAGGGFALLANARDDAPELGDIHRFTHGWERTASLGLRAGRGDAIDAYTAHGRVREGATDQMIDAAYLAWRADTRAGRASILVAEAAQTVDDLNARARAERILDGDTTPGTEAIIAGGVRACAGDLIITRRNDRSLTTPRGGWVRNGDRWRVVHVGRDGAITARRDGARWGGDVTLPAEYVREHVNLGYAVTAHRAQGVTTDTSHVVVSASTTRENLYVSMTRGRSSNIAYVALDKPDDLHTPPRTDDVTARTVLSGVLQHTGAELSAHQTITAEQEKWASIAELAAEYETIAAAAQHARWTTLITDSGLNPEQVADVLASPALGALTAALRRAEAHGHQIERLLPILVTSHGLGDADDPAAVLTHRLNHTHNRSRRGRGQFVAGLFPEALGPMTSEMRQALDERKHAIENRARALADTAVTTGEPWTRSLGTPPDDPRNRERWLTQAATVAAYRDRYAIDSDHPLGNHSHGTAQSLDAAHADAAIRRAHRLADDSAHGADLTGSRVRGPMGL